ncbi:hypothetical protein SVIO_100150 [Streptomyces violaceusniger]|uniref:HTH tetR-type domain-containing protein n=1 Tax=Streptomyces violaceusniger TaxID=68280 RepID=A0A4D4LDN7_STRVO|nr:hypothetical protein SVIO_100150 [Streptomyces violaceusniger]
MPRASRAEAERHREQVIAATAKLVRTHGADKVSVPQAMAAAGLTHGGFYRHFASKDDLVAQACSAAFAERLAAMEEPPRARTRAAPGPPSWPPICPPGTATTRAGVRRRGAGGGRRTGGAR